jgi:hypothetical protein
MYDQRLQMELEDIPYERIGAPLFTVRNNEGVLGASRLFRHAFILLLSHFIQNAIEKSSFTYYYQSTML